MISRRYVISGTVQGVNFRAWAKREAEGLGLAGWVMNLPDGRVAAFAQGADAEKMARFERFLGEGSPGARVAAVETKDAKPDSSLTSFDIRHYPAK
jgi:acylphosphatase